MKKKGFGGSSEIQKGLTMYNKQTKFIKQNQLSTFHFIHDKCNPGFSRVWSTLVLAWYNSKSDDTQQK